MSLRGYGYVEYSIIDSDKETRLSAEFTSRKPDGLIVLAEGNSDHVVVELRKSRIFVSLSIRNLKFGVNTTDGDYSDGEWHRIDVERINSKLKFSVDGQLVEILKVKPQLSGNLNIDRTIFVGGITNFRKPGLTFNTVGRYFHGCIANVTFNGRNILQPSDRPNREASGIGWGRCDEKIFSASPISQSFVPPEAYASYHKWEVRYGGELTFDFRTRQPNGLLIFNGGRVDYNDYIGVELVDGRLRVGIDYGYNATAEIIVGEKLDNWQWQSVSLSVSIKKVQVTVGRYSKTKKIVGRRGLLDVAGALFVGGMRQDTRQEALVKGMVSLTSPDGGSFIGCLRSLTINNVEVNPRESKNSRGVSLGCSYVSPCLLSPCKEGQSCVDNTNRISYQCICHQSNNSCSNIEPVGNETPVNATEPAPMTASASRTTMETAMVTMSTTPHTTTKMKTSNPSPTTIQTTRALTTTEIMPGMLLVEIGSVSVREGGHVVVDVKSVHVVVTGQNDEWVRDHGDNIVFSLMQQPKHGEFKQNIDVITNFTYTSILTGVIGYYHEGSDGSTDITIFTVSFMEQQKTVIVNVTVEPVNDPPTLVRPQGNVRFTVLSGTRSHIMPSDLLVTDSDNSDRDLVFELLSGRQSEGQLELEDKPNIPLVRFTQEQINNNEVLFHHMNQTHRSALVLTLRVTDGQEPFVFRFAISMTDADITLSISPLTVSQGSSVTLNSSNIRVSVDATEKQLEGVKTRFRLVSEPHNGMVMADGRKLKTGDFFTRSAVDTLLVTYIHNVDSYEPEDRFQLEAWVGLSSSQNQTVVVSVSLGLIRVHLSRVTVREGQAAVIDGQHVEVTIDPAVTFPVELVIEVENRTQHGQLAILGDDGQRQAANTFTVRDIENRQLVYSHDSSETDSDSFTFHIRVTSSLPKELEKERMTSSMRVDINVSPVNDQRPEIIRNKELQLLEGSNHTVTSDYLYVEDKDTLPENLIITVTLDPGNGFLSLKTAPEKRISSFTQRDIDDNNVLFTHIRSRSLSGGFSFKATDNNYTTSDQVFAIRVHPLSLNVSAPRGKPLLVDATRSPNSRITPSYLMAQTNDRVQDRDVTFTVVVDSQHGYLAEKRKPNEQIRSFTQGDINDGEIKYFLADENTMAINDSITLQVSIGSSSKDFILFINIIPRPLPLVTVNEGLDVAEHEEVIITKNRLESSDVLDTQSVQIVYYIESGPMYGRIFTSLQSDTTVSSFSQADINQKKVRYLHTGGQSSVDRVILTVSNGKYNRSGIEFLIVIFSKQLKVNVRGLQVQEGSSKPVTSDMIQIRSAAGSPLFFHVSNGPSHGRLTLTGDRSSTVHSFSLSQLTAGEVMYKHDDSESPLDRFEFNITDKSGSLRFTGIFNISVLLVNDNGPQQVNLKPLKPFQYGRVPITDDDLLFTDEDIDYDDSLVQYQVFGGLPGPTMIVRKGEWDTAIKEFTQGDVSSGLIYYVHSGTRLKDKKSLFVSDGRHRDFFFLVIDIQPLNLEVEINTGLVVFAGQKVVIFSNNLTTAINLDHNASDIVYVVTSHPTHGKLLISNIEVLNFTQEDVNNKALMFQHDGSDNTRDSIGMSVSYHSIRPIDMNVAITVDTAPIVSTPNAFTVDEGGNATLTNSFLKASDSDQSADQIIFTVNRPPSSGQLVRVTSTTTPQLITSFSQSDLNSSSIVYQHRGGSTRRDGWVFSVTDGHNVVRSQTMFVEVVPLHIVLESEPLVVDEGGNKRLTEKHLFITNIQLRDRNIKFTLLTTPTHGVLELMSRDGHDLTSDAEDEFVFYSRDMSAGLVWYEHNGEEKFNDSFTVVASEGQKQSDGVRVEVSVIPVNDQRPVVVINKPLSMWANEMTAITTDELSYRDGDTDSGHIVYTITQRPDNGRLLLSTNTSHEIEEFTQLDLEEGRVLFQHFGNNAGGFRFAVSDGNTMLEDIFGVVATPLELTITHITGLVALPGAITPISSYNLSVISNDVNSTRPVTLTLTSPTLLRGSIVSMSPPNHLISNFTMSDIEAGVVGYKHTDLSSWRTDDHFYFNVSMDFAEPLVHQRFSIHILLKHTPGSLLASNNLLTVTEGDISLITNDHLDAANVRAEMGFASGNASVPVSIIYNVTVPPRHGMLVKTSVPGMGLNSFTQTEINTGQVKYKHDSSETVRDSFLFSLTVTNGSVSSLRITEWFNISIVPVNDEPFRVVTFSGLSVVQGMSQIVTRHEMLTVDGDTSDKDVTYEILDQSVNIVLRNIDKPDPSVNRFSQEDVNERRIELVHDGTNILTAQLILRISDGKHEVKVRRFPVSIDPLLVSVLNTSAVELEQGVFSVNISSDQLNVTTNGRIEDIVYVIASSPKFGYLTVKGQRHENFTQTDLDDGHVAYTQQNKKERGDQFVLIVMYSTQATINMTVLVEVKPLVAINQLQSYIGHPVTITSDVLDASRLANLTNSDPLFTIIHPPVSGSILLSKVPGIDLFRHQDILDGDVEYIPELNATDPNMTVYYDQLVFDLSVGDDSSITVQPARGVLPIVLHLTSAPTDTPSVTPHRNATTVVLPSTQPTTNQSVSTVPMQTTSSPSQHTQPTVDSGNPNLAGADSASSGSSESAATVAIPIIVVLFVIIVVILGIVAFHKYRHWKQANISEASGSTSASQTRNTQVTTGAARTAARSSQTQNVVNTDPGVESTDTDGELSDGTGRPKTRQSGRRRRSAVVTEVKREDVDTGNTEGETEWEGTEVVGVRQADPQLQGNEYWV